MVAPCWGFCLPEPIGPGPPEPPLFFLPYQEPSTTVGTASGVELLVGALGLAFVTVSVTWFGAFRGTLRRLKADYLRTINHDLALGLQGIIGTDLVHLLRGWIPGRPAKTVASVLPLLGVAVLVLAIGGSIWLRFDGPLENLPWLIPAAWVAGCGAVAAWIGFGGRHDGRILLIVDDLDRVPANQLLGIVESIKLLLEDPAVSERVSAFAVAEEASLRSAILDKYASLSDPRHKDLEGVPPSRLISENIEKLFIGHLRLSPLTSADVRDLVDLFTGPPLPTGPEVQEGEAELEPAPRASSWTAISNWVGDRVKRGRAGTADEPGDSEAQDDAMAASDVGVPRVAFSVEERSALQAVLPELHEGGSFNGTPRTIRTFLTSYQLARLLLRARGHAVPADYLAAEMAARFLGRRSQNAPTPAGDAIQAVISEVA